MNALRNKRLRTALVAAAAFALTIAPNAWASHVSLTATNLDTVSLGTQIAADLPSDFTTNTGADIGNMVGSVFQNGSVFTYVLDVTPGINNISEFNAGNDVLGFNGVAGFSFSDATAAGGPGAASFEVEHESDGTIDWHTLWKQNGSRGFDANESISFFYQSTLRPALGVYNMINGRSGSTTNYAPIPAPAAFPAGLLLLGALAAARRRHWRIA